GDFRLARKRANDPSRFATSREPVRIFERDSSRESGARPLAFRGKMNNPERILFELDSRLDHCVRLILFGRSALSLGYPGAPDEFSATLDVDAILPEVDMADYEADHQFWDAIEKTNEALEDTGFYITHLFSDEQ